jgi:hypothetical protein
LAEILFGRTDFFWEQVPRSDVTTVLQLEKSIIKETPKPAVIIFGSSRARGAFLPTLMERQMGLRRHQILNFGMGGNGVTRLFDALKIYQRNRDILGKAEIMIIEIENGQLSSIPPTNERFRYLMTFSDWLEYKGEARLSLMRSVLFRLPDALPYIRKYFKHWLLYRQPPKPIGIDQYGRLALVRIANDHSDHVSKADVIRRSINEGYRDFKYSKIYEGYLVKLMSLAKTDGLKVCLIQMPFPEKFISILKQHFKDPYGQFTGNIFSAVNGLADLVQFWESPSEVGLRNNDFRDMEHLNTEGAVKWTTFFVRWLTRSLNMKKSHV